MTIFDRDDFDGADVDENDPETDRGSALDESDLGTDRGPLFGEETEEIPAARARDRYRIKDEIPSKPPAFELVSWDDWKTTWIVARLFALALTKLHMLAWELRQATYLAILDTRTWASDTVAFKTHVLRTMRSIFNHEKEKCENGEGAQDTGAAEDALFPPQHVSTPEQRLIDKHETAVCERVLEVLCEELSEYPDALGIVRLTQEGVDEPEEQAEALGITVQKVYKERARIKRYRTRVYEIVNKGRKGNG